MNTALNSEIASTLDAFRLDLTKSYDVADVILFGSRARQDHSQASDVDVAVLLRGKPGPRSDTTLAIADIAFEVMLDTGILIEAIPFWETEWILPETFSNPALIANIKRDGVHV